MTPPALAPAEPVPTLLHLSLSRLLPHPANRQHHKTQDLPQLATSLKAGQITALTVRHHPTLPEAYEILAGERRWLAAKLAKLPTLLCQVREPCDDTEALRVLAQENHDRLDPHPLDDAVLYDTIRRRPGLDSIEAIAALVKRPAPYVRDRLQLIKLCPEVATAFLEQEGFRLNDAMLLARLAPDDQRSALTALQTPYNRMTHADLERWVASNVLCRLPNATWDLTDATLVPAAGACGVCPKRSSLAPELFDAMLPKADKKDDQCLDPVCFKNKALVQLTNARAQIRAEAVKRAASPDTVAGGGEVLHVTTEQYQITQDGITSLAAGSWKKATPEAKGAVPAVITHGKGAGQPVWVVPVTKDKGTAGGAVETLAKQEARARQKQQAEGRRRALILRAITAKLPKELKAEDLRAIAIGFLGEMHSESKKKVATFYELKPKKAGWGGNDWEGAVLSLVKTMDAAYLTQFLQCLPLFCTTAHDRDPLMETAKRLKVDLTAIDRGIAKAAAEKAKGKRATPPAKKATPAKTGKKLAGDVRRAKAAKR